MARGDGELELSVGVRGAGGGAGAAAADHVAPISLGRLILAGMVAGGVQYGWALQLSLLTPYVQTLGLSHALTSFMWLCGPIAGLVVQPLVGLYSDRCTARWGRRRPFILTGCILISLAVIVVGFSSDIGAALGDTKEHCSLYHGPRWHAAIVYVLGFWLLDFSNNTVQGPARAMMADLCGHHGREGQHPGVRRGVGVRPHRRRRGRVPAAQDLQAPVQGRQRGRPLIEPGPIAGARHGDTTQPCKSCCMLKVEQNKKQAKRETIVCFCCVWSIGVARWRRRYQCLVRSLCWCY